MMNHKTIKRTSMLMTLFLFFCYTIPQINSVLGEEYIIGTPNVFIGEGYFDGYNLFILERRNLINFITLDVTLLILDMQGNVVVQKDLEVDSSTEPARGVARAVEFVNSTTLIYGNENGSVLWNIETDVEEFMNFTGHHEYEKNPNDNTYFTLNQYLVNYDGLDYVYDRISEYTPSGKLIWSVNMSDFITVDQWCPFEDSGEVGTADLTHLNSIFYDPYEDILYVNSRNMNTFYKIDHKTGDIIWGLGEFGDFELYDLEGNLKDILFYHGHALTRISEDTFILFDNDFHNQEDATSRKSKIMEIKVDEDKMEAYVVWEWVSPAAYYCSWWGDADRLPNGNRLGIFGAMAHSGSSEIGARLVEVTEKGEIVWEINYPKIDSAAYGVYDMDRIQFSPIVLINDSYWIKAGQQAIVTAEMFYNFRDQQTNTGTYTVYFEEELFVENEEITFDSFWQPTNIELDFGLLKKGVYNLTFVVEDQENHQTVKNVNVTVSKNPPNDSSFEFVSVPISIGLIVILRRILIKHRKKVKNVLRYHQ